MSSPECPICNGAGYVYPRENGQVVYNRVIPCVCVKDELIKKRFRLLLQHSELPPIAEEMSFETFQSYKEVHRAYKLAKYVATNPHETHWVIFQGWNDTGKTHLAVAICKEWIKQGVPCKYAFVPLLLDELREGFREGFKLQGDDYHSRFKRLCEVPLLVLDDLGAESSTPWVNEKLETLVDFRYMHRLSLVVTTNSTFEELTPRLRSRLVRHPNAKLLVIDAKEYTLTRTQNVK